MLRCDGLSRGMRGSACLGQEDVSKCWNEHIVKSLIDRILEKAHAKCVE